MCFTRASKAYKIRKSHGDKLVVGVLSDKVAGKADMFLKN